LEAYTNYYTDKAQFWEIQAVTRARAVAGDANLGKAFIDMIEPIWRERAKTPDRAMQIAKMRYRIETERGDPTNRNLEFKTGAGGLIDVEFAVQQHLMERGIREPGTWTGLKILGEKHPTLAESWRGDYLFLRRIESMLRCDENSSVSALPKEIRERDKLGRRLGFEGEASFMQAYDRARARIRGGYEQLMPSVPH
jgi:glutamate-ammonia-ligase adenylyltransferase